MMLMRILAYFVPFAINFLTGGFFFITSYQFSRAGCPGVVVGGAVAAWGVSYCLISMVIGRIAKVSNALPLILTGGTILLLTSAGFMVFDGLYTQFLWLATAGCGAAIFCTPFQLLAKSIEEGGGDPGTVSATSFYTFTWSVGFASGPLAFARLTGKQGFTVTLILAAAVTLSVLAISFMLRRRNGGKTPEPGAEKPTPVRRASAANFSGGSFTKLAVLGWIVGGLGTLTVCQIRSMWPKLGSELGIPQHHVACILALVSYSQALTALALCRSRSWMWRRLPALMMALTGIAGLLLFAFGGGVKIFYLAAAVYGIYSGCIYFSLVYHSLSHPEKSGFFVAGNEIIVGVVSMVSPLIGGLLADTFKMTAAAFIFAALVSAAALIAQLAILNTIPENEKVSEDRHEQQ